MFYGAQYYRPPFPDKSCWNRDLENMKKNGFNCIKLWAVWNWIERKKGEFHFEELDELVKLSKAFGLMVIINTIPEGAPYWTYSGNSEDLYRTADGQIVEYGGPANIPSGGWPGLCMDNPEFAVLTARFIEETARHFADEEAVIAIDVWNEPHLEPMYDYRDNMLCYCGHSKKAFRAWLVGKYRNLQNLNKAWYRTYDQWEQVSPPTRFGTWADMLDWRGFWLENLQKWLRIRVEACKKGAPYKRVQTHVAYSGILGNRIVGGLANELGDEFLLAKEVDWFGISSFPKWLMGPQHIYRHFLHNTMIAEAAHGKLFYQVELQGGAGKPGLLGGEVPDARDVKLWNYNTVAAGGKGSVYWQYAPEPSGVESPGFGLTGFRGEDTERSMAAGEMAKALNERFLDAAKPMPCLNAVYVSRSSDLLTFASERREQMYAESLSGVLKALYHKGIPVRFFHEDYILELRTSGIKTLYLPMALVLSEQEIQEFQRFVEEGGILISEACPGLYHPNGELDMEGKALETLFGCSHKEIQGQKDWGEVSACWCDTNKTFTGRFYRQTVHPKENVNVLARFLDGEAAVTSRKAGKGVSVWIGTYPSCHYETTEDTDTGDLLTKWMYSKGYEAVKSLTCQSAEKDNDGLAPLVRLLESEEEYVLVAVNHTRSLASVRVQMNHEEKEIALEVLPSDGNIYRWKK